MPLRPDDGAPVPFGVLSCLAGAFEANGAWCRPLAERAWGAV